VVEGPCQIGVPINVGFLDTQEFNPGHKIFLPVEHVDYCFHALAMDERRQTFRVTRALNAYEVWFRGVHSDVGGGNGNVGLSYIALRWMLGKAKAAGLPITEAAIASRDGKINPDAPLRPPKDLIAAFCRATASITRWSKEQGITILRQVHSVRPRRMTHKPAVSRTFPIEKRSQFNRARGMVIASSLQQPAKGCKKCVFCRGVINTCVASAGIAECGAFKRN
jgi:hypothetical protein